MKNMIQKNDKVQENKLIAGEGRERFMIEYKLK